MTAIVVDKRVRLAIVSPCERRDGGVHWVRVGTAYVNADQTIDVYLDVIALTHRLRLRPLAVGEGFVPDASITKQ